MSAKAGPERLPDPKAPIFNQGEIPKSLRKMGACFSTWGGLIDKPWPNDNEPTHIVPMLDKAPRTISGSHARSNDPKTWAPLAESVVAVESSSHLVGIGVQLLGGPLFGIDLDHVLTQKGAVRSEYKELVNLCSQKTYVEVSPSGTGLRVFFRKTAAVNGRADSSFSWTEGENTPDKRHKRGVELYLGNKGRFLTITGNRLPAARVDIAPITVDTLKRLDIEIAALHRRSVRFGAGPSAPGSVGAGGGTGGNALGVDDLVRKLRDAGLSPQSPARAEQGMHVKLGSCPECGSRSGGTVHYFDGGRISFSCFSTKCPAHADKPDAKAAQREATARLVERIGWAQPKRSNLKGVAPGGHSAPPIPRTAKDIEPEEVTWLIDGWMLRKGVHLIAGKQGEGKSYFLAYLAAALSRGSEIKDLGKPPPCRVLYCASEDDAPSILRPRLEQCGADLRYIEIVDNAFSATEYLNFVISQIEEKCKRQRNRPLVVILDALDSFLGIGDAKDNQEVRAGLEALRACAEINNVTILGVKHKRKDDNDWSDVYSVAGASAYTEVARVVWMLKRDDARSTVLVSQVLLEVAKNNYAGIKAGVEFHISGEGIDWKGDTGRRLQDLRAEATRETQQKIKKREFWKRLAAGIQERTYVRKKLLAIGKEVGLGESTVDKYVREGVENGWLRRLGKNRAGRYRTTPNAAHATFEA